MNEKQSVWSMTVELCITAKLLGLLFMSGHNDIDFCHLVQGRETGNPRLKLGVGDVGLGLRAKYGVPGTEVLISLR